MNMRCKQCGEAFPSNQPFDMFEMRRSKVLPADTEAMTNSVHMEDAGLFCSRKCLGDYVRGSGDRSGVFDLAGLRKKVEGMDQK
jgi:hypothetical protein